MALKQRDVEEAGMTEQMAHTGDGGAAVWLLARVGWMKFYRGPAPGDERPVGGGAYNRTGLGNECYNFLPISGKVYGYFKAPGRNETLRLDRVLSGFTGDRIDRITLVFIAGNKVVGWYRNAMLYRLQPTGGPGLKEREGFGYHAVALSSDAVLVPEQERSFTVPVQVKGCFGQCNVYYPLTDRGLPRQEKWCKGLLEYVDSYSGPNLMDAPIADLQADVDHSLEAGLSEVRGQKYCTNTRVRIAVERYAVDIARMHFHREGYKVKDVGKPYDLLCSRGGETLFVEVKGTQRGGDGVFLTPNEVAFAREHTDRMVLFVVHSIRVSLEPELKVDGGKAWVVQPWDASDDRLRQIVGYWYDLSGLEEGPQ